MGTRGIVSGENGSLTRGALDSRLRRVGGRETMGHNGQRGDADDGSVGVPVMR